MNGRPHCFDETKASDSDISDETDENGFYCFFVFAEWKIEWLDMEMANKIMELHAV